MIYIFIYIMEEGETQVRVEREIAGKERQSGEQKREKERERESDGCRREKAKVR